LGGSFERLVYRNQFVLGPRHVDFPGWAKLQIRPDILVTAHPDLMCCQAVDGPCSLTLLGFMLDPEDPAKGDQAIVDGLLSSGGTWSAGPAGVIPSTFKYAGRWIPIADDGHQVVVFNDPAGMRSVFYATDADAVWCASQPGMLAQLLNRQTSPEALEIIDSLGFRNNPEYWWPGCGSPFVGVEHLLPNHLLDLTRGTMQRYWPDRDLPRLRLNDAVKVVAGTLRGIMMSAASRFDLAVSVTAGLDSRLVLAASRDVADHVAYHTVRQLAMPDDHPDIAVPAALLSRLGLRHELIRAIPFVDPEFASAFQANTPLAHRHYEPDAAAIFSAYGGSKVTVTGSVSEAVRNPLSLMGRRSIVGPTSDREMARLWFFTTAPGAVRAIERWRAELGHTYNVGPDTLFYLEQRAGNWGAMTQLEFDTAWRDILTPFNCRALLATMLGVEEPSRHKALYLRVTERLWPELLRTPINPHRRKKGTVLTRVRKHLRGAAASIPAVRQWGHARRPKA
jgi:hypothetical protein